MRTILSALLLLCSLCGNAADILTIQVDLGSAQFAVTLAANPTTGYQWTVTSYDKTILRMTNSHYAAPHTKLIGAGGATTFTFALIKGKTYPKSTRMSFTYARPWEPKTGTVKKVTVDFTKSKK